MSYDSNGNSKADIDVLDFPLYSRNPEDDFTNNESQFRLNIPDIDPNTVQDVVAQENLNLEDVHILEENGENNQLLSDDVDDNHSDDLYVQPAHLGTEAGDFTGPRVSSWDRRHTEKYL